MRKRQRRSPKFVRAATSVCVFLVIIVLPGHGDRVRASPCALWLGSSSLGPLVTCVDGVLATLLLRVGNSPAI